MDYKKYQKTKSDLEHYDDRIATLQELLKEANQKRQIICDECSHDFVFVYNAEAEQIGHPENGIRKNAQCLVCGTYFRLDENYVEFESGEILTSKHIIDATDYLLDYTQRSYSGNENVAYTEAKNVFEELINIDTGHIRDEQVLKQIEKNVKKLDDFNVEQENARRQGYEGPQVVKLKNK